MAFAPMSAARFLANTISSSFTLLRLRSTITLLLVWLAMVATSLQSATSAAELWRTCAPASVRVTNAQPLRERLSSTATALVICWGVFSYRTSRVYCGARPLVRNALAGPQIRPLSNSRMPRPMFRRNTSLAPSANRQPRTLRYRMANG